MITFRIDDKMDWMRGIPSMDVAITIALDFYRTDAEWDFFLEEKGERSEVRVVTLKAGETGGVVNFKTGRMVATISAERRCDCCGSVLRGRAA